MNEPEITYAERPPSKPHPAEVEAQLKEAGCRPPDFGMLSHVDHLRDNVADCDIDPLHAGNPVFDFETIYKRLDGEGESSLEHADDDTRRLAMKISARALALVFDYLLTIEGGSRHRQEGLKIIGIRAVAAAWVIDPVRFQGASLKTVANLFGFKSGGSLSASTAEFSRRFGIKNHFQSHDWRSN